MTFIPGANVGQYRIVEQVERSGVGTSYTAYQPSVGRYVAVTVVPGVEREHGARRRQYEHQASLAAAFRHPNVLTVLDHGEHLGLPYLVTELVQSEPLAERLGARRPLGEVIRILRPIAAGLDAAHAQGLVHGDLRPSAIGIMPDGTPILTGFGLSTGAAGADAGALSRDAHPWDGEIGDETARTRELDRRGLALIAYHMLTGHGAVGAAGDGLGSPQGSGGGDSALAPEVEALFERELSGPPGERFGSSIEFVDALADAQRAARPVAAAVIASASVGPSDPSRAARRRLLTVAAIFAALALLGGLAVAIGGGNPIRPAAPGRTIEPELPATRPSTALPLFVAPTGSVAIASPTTVGRPASPAPGAAGSPAPLSSPAPVVANSPAAAPTAARAASPPAGPASATPLAVSLPPTPAAVPTNRPSAPPPTSPVAPARTPTSWRVIGDPSGRWTYDDQGRVVGRTESGASMILFPENVGDVEFSALVSTSTCQASLVFRAQDEENLLMAIYIPDGLPNPGATGGGVWLYQRVEGRDIPIRAVRPSTVRDAGEPVRLKIATTGPQIAISLNDEPALQAVDAAARPGRLGLLVYSTSGRLCEAAFGDIKR